MTLKRIGIPAAVIGMLFLIAVLPFLRPAQIGTITLIQGQGAAVGQSPLPQNNNHRGETGVSDAMPGGFAYILAWHAVDNVCKFELMDKHRTPLWNWDRPGPCDVDALREFAEKVGSQFGYIKDVIKKLAEDFIRTLMDGGVP
jgi:hypothetical protein